MRFPAALAFTLATATLLVPAWAEKKPQIPLSSVSFVVVRDENGKPIRNAAVVIHPVNGKGKQEAGGIELKTDPDGEAGGKPMKDLKKYLAFKDLAPPRAASSGN